MILAGGRQVARCYTKLGNLKSGLSLEIRFTNQSKGLFYIAYLITRKLKRITKNENLRTTDIMRNRLLSLLNRCPIENYAKRINIHGLQ